MVMSNRNKRAFRGVYSLIISGLTRGRRAGDWDWILEEENDAMAFVSGYHHLTLSTDGVQEDYDFYTKILGLHSVKRTVLFDGTIPVYHLYYGSRDGDASTIITTFPFRKPAVFGRR